MSGWKTSSRKVCNKERCKKSNECSSISVSKKKYKPDLFFAYCWYWHILLTPYLRRTSSQQCTSSLTLSTSLYEGLISEPMPAALGVPKMSPIQVLSWTYFCVHTGEEYPTWHGHWLQFPFLVLFFNLSLFHPMQHNLASIFLLSEHTVRDAPPWGTWLRTLRHWWRKAGKESRK